MGPNLRIKYLQHIIDFLTLIFPGYRFQECLDHHQSPNLIHFFRLASCTQVQVHFCALPGPGINTPLGSGIAAIARCELMWDFLFLFYWCRLHRAVRSEFLKTLDRPFLNLGPTRLSSTSGNLNSETEMQLYSQSNAEESIRVKSMKSERSEWSGR